eukprot:1160528-Pelagomonas_calceolata.AAC.5
MYANLEGILERELLDGRGSEEGVPTTPHPPLGHKYLTMPREKGPEWDYVTFVQPEGTDGVKQGKNKCKLCSRACVSWRCHAHQHTLLDKEGEEGGQQEEGSSSDGEGLFTGKMRTQSRILRIYVYEMVAEHGN